jgi:hypothetical protein
MAYIVYKEFYKFIKDTNSQIDARYLGCFAVPNELSDLYLTSSNIEFQVYFFDFLLRFKAVRLIASSSEVNGWRFRPAMALFTDGTYHSGD